MLTVLRASFPSARWACRRSAWFAVGRLAIGLLLAGRPLSLQAGPSLGLPADLITAVPVPGAVRIFDGQHGIALCVDDRDCTGVLRAAADLQADIARVGGPTPELLHAIPPGATTALVIGTIGHSALIDDLIRAGQGSLNELRGKWEAFRIVTVDHPWPGLDQALVIVGSDRRGTIYGLYELSEQLGVSPWYWWADVPPPQRSAAYVLPGSHDSGEPVVRYRGIFLNNEAPALTGWAREKFGGLNSAFYTKVFELLLRLRANMLWPAMWNNAFSVDDPANPRLANDYGIVMGTSHHEPMMRAHREWTDHQADYGNGQWNYATNAPALQRFFREGIARHKDYENLVTVGLRGDGDEAMVSTGSLAGDIAQLEQIFTDQRRILAEEMQVDPATVPQLWALFTEVQKFYEAGLRPPDDVTLLWTDDNTGNLRRLPTAEERQRRGGAGIYYHFDMHGGPYAFQWINTMPLPKIAEQMHLAAAYDATRIWIVNVGDLKPLELPIEFFLRLAWNPAALPKDAIAAYTRRWAERDFGPDHAVEIADLVRLYTKYNGWRKPEMVRPDTFSQLHYQEADRVLAAWQDLAARAERVAAQLAPAQRDAFFELVLHPTLASALVVEMNILAGRNQLYGQQGRTSTNAVAARVRDLFRADQALSDRYNHDIAGGKWIHLMDQPHLGQFSWEPPIVNVQPPLVEVLPADDNRYGVAVEGDVGTWPDHYGSAALPRFDSLQPRRSYVDVFALGTQPIDVTVTAVEPWIKLSAETTSPGDRRHGVELDWTLVPVGVSRGTITVTGSRGTVTVAVPVTKATPAEAAAAVGRFASLTGPVAIAAADAPTRSVVQGATWEKIPDLGRSDFAMGIYPVTTGSVLPPHPAPRLTYPVYLPRAGTYTVTLEIGPVMDFVPDRGMRLAVSFDDAAPQVLDIFADRDRETFLGPQWWNQFTKDGIRYLRSTHTLATAGPHSLTLRMVDPGIVVEKIVIHDAPLPPSYFGPPAQTMRTAPAAAAADAADGNSSADD